MKMTISEHVIMWIWKVVLSINITAIRAAYHTEKLFSVIAKEKG